MRIFPLALAGCLVMAGCGGAETPSDTAAGFEPPAPQRPDPIPGQAQTTPLTAYLGRYPDEPVDGVGFFDRTEVATALDGAVTDAALRRAVVRNQGPRTPIFRVGARIATWGCEAHNCDDRNWTLLVDPQSGKGELCLHEGGGGSRWYAGGPPVTRPGGCPSERPGQARPA
jgi:hypothetical protein